jgi:peptidoglycan/LPS O-acetylase OafA/YrhL
VTSPAQDPQLQGIELLRGVAALMVLLAHYQLQFAGRPAWLGFSQTGVDLFFVLSGFVFGPWLFGRRVDLLPHLLRRLFHIYPLYLVALAAYVALHWAQGQPPLYLLDHVFMLHTLSRDVAQHYNAAFWSLPVEVEFYLLLPLLSWFVRHGAGFGPLLVLALGLHRRFTCPGCCVNFWLAPSAGTGCASARGRLHPCSRGPWAAAGCWRWPHTRTLQRRPAVPTRCAPLLPPTWACCPRWATPASLSRWWRACSGARRTRAWCGGRAT